MSNPTTAAPQVEGKLRRLLAAAQGKSKTNALTVDDARSMLAKLLEDGEGWNLVLADADRGPGSFIVATVDEQVVVVAAGRAEPAQVKSALDDFDHARLLHLLTRRVGLAARCRIAKGALEGWLPEAQPRGTLCFHADRQMFTGIARRRFSSRDLRELPGGAAYFLLAPDHVDCLRRSHLDDHPSTRCDGDLLIKIRDNLWYGARGRNLPSQLRDARFINLDADPDRERTGLCDDALVVRQLSYTQCVYSCQGELRPVRRRNR